jgi:hypothetical protein
MPRPKASTAKTPSKSHKRQLSSSATPQTNGNTTAPGSRQSKRIKASTEATPTTNGKKLTPRKSKYFEGSGSDEDEQSEASPGAKDGETSGYEDEDASASHASSVTPSSAAASSDDSEEEAYDSEDVPKKGGRKTKKKTPMGKHSTSKGKPTSPGGIMEKGKELWRQGVKVGLGPGKAVFIERPKPRGDGGIKYVPGKIHPNTMSFLGDLSANNEREWLKCEWIFCFCRGLCLG